MRKSSLILLLAMAFVLTTVVSGFCVVNEVGEPCVICDGGKGVGWDYGLQIKMDKCDTAVQGTVCPCPTFDYELGDVTANTDPAYQSIPNYNYPGYCDGQDVQGIIFKLCDCEKIAEMSTASSYAIRLTIMEPASGVYWTNQNVAKQDCYDAAVEDCTDAGTLPLAAGSVYVSSHEDPALSGGNYCIDPCDATDGSANALSYYSATAGQSLYDPSANAGIDCCFTCGTNRVKAVQTCYSRIMNNLESILVIDIPTLVYDPNDINVQLGTAVKVKVEIVEMPAGGDICAGACKSICECIVKIGEFTDCSPDGCTLCLPYLPAADSGWWAGMAFTNNCSKPALVELSFFAAGTTAKYTFAVPAKSVETLVLSAILDDLAGLATDAPIYVNVVAAAAIDTKIEGACGVSAYVMMGNGTEAQGYVAPYGPCGCGYAGSLLSNYIN